MTELMHASETLNTEALDTEEYTAEYATDASDLPDEQSFWLRLPIARIFAFLAGGGLTSLGLLSLIPALRVHDTLLGFYHADLSTALTYLITGLAGLAIARIGDRRATLAYIILMPLIYIWTFDATQVNFEDFIDAPTTYGVRYLVGLPYFLADGLHMGVALGAAAALIADSMQKSTLATIQYRNRRVRVYFSRTKLPKTSKASKVA